MPNAFQLINDDFEADGLHLVCLNDEGELLGSGRLNINGKTAIISQMAIKKERRKQGMGRKILTEFIQKCKEQNLQEIQLSARKTAIEFYKKFGFQTVGNEYPSTKTGVLHQKMHLHLKTTDQTKT